MIFIFTIGGGGMPYSMQDWPSVSGILVPWPGIKPVPPAVEVQRLNH